MYLLFFKKTNVYFRTMRIHNSNYSVPKKSRQKVRGFRSAYAKSEDDADFSSPTEIFYESRGYRDTPGQLPRYILQQPRDEYIHVVTPQEAVDRLSLLENDVGREIAIEIVQFSTGTNKQMRDLLYGLQWGTSIYLYPMHESLTEQLAEPLNPIARQEYEKYGAKYVVKNPDEWSIQWGLETIRDFYLNNILIHEAGHMDDDRNTSPAKREAYANWFAETYGYPRSEAAAKRHQEQGKRKHIRKRHHNA